MKIIWRPRALRRLDDIADFIADDHPEAAQRLVAGIFAAVERLENFPLSGRIVPEVNRGNIREVIHRKYRIIYRVRSKTVDILTVRHSRQELSLAEIKGRK